MASMNSLRTAFSSLAINPSHTLKGKARHLDPTRLSLRALSTPAPASTSSASPGPSLSSGPAPTSAIASTPTALALLRTQPHHYVVASLAGRTLLLAASDVVTLPRLRDVRIGDVLHLSRIHELGSRDYTLRAHDPTHCRRRTAFPLPTTAAGTPADAGAAAGVGAEHEALAVAPSWATRLLPAGLAHIGAVLDPSTVRVRAVVVEHTKGSMERIVKKKRRKGYRKTVQHKQPYTRIRIDRIDVAPSEG